MNVTRAVLPVMRKQRSGHIISISSSAGLAAGFEFVSAYAASKFGLEGWMESLQAEVAPFGITTTIVNPGFFRTELLTEQSTNYAEPSIADYDERRGPLVEYWKAQNGQQSGDPAKLARALITIASEEPPPRRFIAGADAIATAEQKIADLKAQIEAHRDSRRHSLSTEAPACGDVATVQRWVNDLRCGSSILRFGGFCKLLIGDVWSGSPHWTISATGSSVKRPGVGVFRPIIAPHSRECAPKALNRRSDVSEATDPTLAPSRVNVSSRESSPPGEKGAE